MFKVDNKDTKMKQKHHSGVFIVNVEHISHLALVFLLWTLNMQFTAENLIDNIRPNLVQIPKSFHLSIE